jgi:exodeoxyribonuclease VII large subunit
VGHEPDITISDYVADARASTPSNAAEIAVKDAFELKRALGDLAFTLAKYQTDRIKAERTRLARLTQTPVMTDPRQYFTDRRLSLDVLSDRLASSMRLTLERRRAQTARLAAGLDAMSPLKVLSRGYSVVTDGRGVVRSVGRLTPGGEISVRLSDGSADCTVVRVTKEQKENVS